MTVDLEGIHHLVPESLQVDAKNLKDQGERTPKRGFAMGILLKQHIPVQLSLAEVLHMMVMNPAAPSAWSRYRTLPPKQTAVSVPPVASPPQWLLKEN